MIEYLFLSMTKSNKTTRLIEKELNKPYRVISIKEFTVEQAKNEIKQINFDNCKLVVQIYPDKDDRIVSKVVEDYLLNWMLPIVSFILSETNIKNKFSIAQGISQTLDQVLEYIKIVGE